jgi:hypothetical protein
MVACSSCADRGANENSVHEEIGIAVQTHLGATLLPHEIDAARAEGNVQRGERLIEALTQLEVRDIRRRAYAGELEERLNQIG